ncbi:hypothetical protein SUGI_0082510 [Cryptomeria japonica]|nr:hypothetical protein SUGI_0082510 [Cryptomeria japonica]
MKSLSANTLIQVAYKREFIENSRTLSSKVEYKGPIGEAIIRATVARDVATLMEYKGLSLQDYVDYVKNKWFEDGKGGLIVVSSNGEVVAGFNTMGMFKACAIEAGYYEIGIWH